MRSRRVSIFLEEMMLQTTLKKTVFGLACLFAVAQPSFALDLSVAGSYFDVEDLDASYGPSVVLSESVYEEWVDLEFGAAWLMGEEEDVDFSLVPLDLGVKVHLTSGCEYDPYLRGGATYMAVDEDSDEVELDGDWGAYVGAGVAYPLDKQWDIYTEILWRWNELDANAGGVEFANAVDANGTQVNLGVTYSFDSEM
jgi:hypothetical protein